MKFLVTPSLVYKKRRFYLKIYKDRDVKLNYFRVNKLNDDAYYLEQENAFSFYFDKELADMERRHKVINRNLGTLALVLFSSTCIWIFNKLKIRLRGRRSLFVVIDLLIGLSPCFIPFLNNIPNPIFNFLLAIVLNFFLIVGASRLSALISLLIFGGSIAFNSTGIIFLIDIGAILFLVVGCLVIKKYVHSNNQKLLLLIDHVDTYKNDVLSQFWIYRVFNPKFHK